MTNANIVGLLTLKKIIANELKSNPSIKVFINDSNVM